ncbi:hypothetical protein SDC9_95677 [bioreactor metagenome]|uniref:Uncharacterized protein n=1 Tax=bioreactor metagenome TaxID=1076179 RepID=A0A645A702_9ZZZZ
MCDEGHPALALLKVSILASRPFRGDGQNMPVLKDLETGIHGTSTHILPVDGNALPHIHQVGHELLFPQLLFGKCVQRPRLEECIEHRSFQIRGVVHHH